ncbi:hypothetical protein [uncultured Pseudoalteromonas sp.]|uniref:hypothetical protein n=1 Tax=unclassified Pseudoalteromonas TaxID=194690 RepID=UPI0030D90EC5|tara:strand:+ start:30969 stop:31772 length:804 start_codon:yes stop_codon:yes gene_type:complete
MELVHHYTNINSLECILKNRTLRLNRLDKVDDKQEVSLISQKHWAQYLFVSSWSASEHESEAMWSKYACYNGVRLSLPKFPFKKNQLISKPEMSIFFGDNTYSPIPFESIYNEKWLFVISPIRNDIYGREVVYKCSPEESIRPIVKNVDGGFEFNYFDLATFKNVAWGYQKEFRYIFFIIPSSSDVMNDWKKTGDPASIHRRLLKCLQDNVDNTLEYFDIPLGDVIESVEITLGPCCSESEVLKIKKLLDEYTSNAKIKQSVLTGYV